ncbi:MAG: thymidine phosphorylase family protein [Candidatus Berkiella sp.]
MNKVSENSKLRLKYLGIDTYQESVLYMRKDCHVCKAEGFEAQTRILVECKGKSIIATLNTINTDLLKDDEASLSAYAWSFLGASEGDKINLSHPPSLKSLKYVRSKIYGSSFSKAQLTSIIQDIVHGRYSDIQISMFLTACAGVGLNINEILHLAEAMIDSGQRIEWPSPIVVDKHCIGGLPGNRTTLIVVPIIAEFGLTIPKTSSRAITSPAGTADTMEVFSQVNLNLQKMRKVVEQENGCIIWGGSVFLSPADDTLIHIERGMDLDTEGQMVASILSKKVAAGSNHIVIDVPVGPSAKIRSVQKAEALRNYLQIIGLQLGVEVKVIFTDGSQPVGRGVGPALEAAEVLSVLTCDKEAPADLRSRALLLASEILEFSKKVPKGKGLQMANEILDSGRALKKFEAICKAQGGMTLPGKAPYTHVVAAKSHGYVDYIDNRRLAKIAKLAGAPQAKTAGLYLQTALHARIEKGEPLFTIHAESKGELSYAVSYLKSEKPIYEIREHQ